MDDYHGTPVADPYRGLEALGSEATSAWVLAENRLTHDVLAMLSDRAAIHDRLSTLWSYARCGVPWREAGHLYFEENTGFQNQAVLYTVDAPGDDPRVVLDPQSISPDGSIAIRDFAVSPDGHWLSYWASPGGADAGRIRIRDLSTGRELGDSVHGRNVCWTPDGGGFFYAAEPSGPRESTAATPRKVLAYHTLGQPETEDRIVHTWEDGRWLWSMLSDDGRYLIAVLERGAGSLVYSLDLGTAGAADFSAPFVPLLVGLEASHTPMGTAGDTLYAWTDLEAPRGRIVALDLSAGAVARPWTVVAQTSEVIQAAAVAGDRLAVHYIEDVKSVLRLFTLEGQDMGEVQLPGIGAIGWPFNGRHSAPELWYCFTSFLFPETVYRYDTRTGTSMSFRAPRIPFDTKPYETRQVFYPSKDGTLVPMFLTAKKSLPRDAKAAVFLTAYGGYGTIVNPSYRPDVPLWLEMGGVYAVANLRGGGEYGEEWHRAGMLQFKQNSFDDFIAAARYLVQEHYTVPDEIAIYGHSNGGLLVGAVMTQQPELFGAAVANAGHYDMLRYHKFTAGAAWVPEYGSADDPSDFRYLRTYSPLHNVHAGTCYPATLLLTGDHDDRVVPSHSYKFAATLQAAQGCDRPILLRVASNASHSYASQEAEIAESTDMWVFVAASLGVRMPRPH